MKNFFVVVTMLVATLQAVSGETWYVDRTASASGDGTSWATAFKTIQKGIDAASDGDTVIVGEGTYKEAVEFKGANIVLTSTDPADASVVGATIIDGEHTRTAVRFSGAEIETCILTGFTIRNGFSDILCGGINGWNSRATIENNVITGNVGKYGGGVYACLGTVQNNFVIDNSATSGGGLWGCSGTVRHNTISGNSADTGGGLAGCMGVIEYNSISANSARTGENQKGGGLYECHGTIQNNFIMANSAATGGGLYLCSGAIRYNIISGNSAGSGAGLYICDGTIEGDVITENSASSRGGGLQGCGGEILNCLIAGNSAPSNGGYGGGLGGCNAAIINCTITGNLGRVGGGLYNCDGVIQNCIIWGNTATVNGQQLFYSSTPTFSCIQDWTGSGGGNTSGNPLFKDPDGPDNDPDTYVDNDYRLRLPSLTASPCIDKGKNEAWMWNALDLDGNNRIYQGTSTPTVDMGAYEHGSYPFRIAKLIKQFGLMVQLTWNSAPADSYVVWSTPSLPPPGAWTWTREATVRSDGETASWTDPDTTALRKFYMIELKRPPAVLE